ncbi:MAG: RtcB family protein [Desulfobacteraceae bacterium]|nr:RtcB family protein [Desulfobacteraceae bacterium]MCF8094851.1 RtcB family protein [Desulfobacteraceae bacterium]
MELTRIDDYRWEIKKSGAMNVDARIYSSSALIGAVKKDETFRQLTNVAQLPGIVGRAMAMPDIHWGYGFPIGGVAAFDIDTGIISPGGVGYDINCGVRLAATGLFESEVRPKLEHLAVVLQRDIPSGVGSTGPLKLSDAKLKKVLKQGGPWAISRGYGEPSDAERTEDGGCMSEADPSAVSNRALERGRKQLGTLGSGNHFIEIGVVDTIYDPGAADAFGLKAGQVTLLIHTGSRGLGHQICDDFLAAMTKKVHQTGINLPDRQLACMPINSAEGKAYYRAMACAANFAWANRQILMHLAGDAFMSALGISPRDLSMRLVYDVCHNIAKIEAHTLEGREQNVCVHRKGATRAFAPGHPGLSDTYRKVGQPILIPGDMGTASYVLVGTQQAMDETFGSTCHGAGRVMSRKAAKKAAKGRSLQQELEKKGILIRASGKGTMAEEMPDAYKDVTEVVDVVDGSGISKKVAKLRPIAAIKG